MVWGGTTALSKGSRKSDVRGRRSETSEEKEVTPEEDDSLIL